MSFAGIILRLSEVVTHIIELPQTLAEQLTDGDAERLGQPFDVSRVRVTPRGFLFTLAPGDNFPGGELRDEQKHFPAFLHAMEEAGLPPARALQFEGEPAIGVFVTFSRWLDLKAAEKYELDITAGTMTFERARELHPTIFDVPRFQAFFAQCFKSNLELKKKKGKRFIYSENVENLYVLACRIYRESPGYSLENACADACEQRLDLVPTTWGDDPGGNLKREAQRVWDKSKWSQLSFRQRRDR